MKQQGENMHPLLRIFGQMNRSLGRSLMQNPAISEHLTELRSVCHPVAINTFGISSLSNILYTQEELITKSYANTKNKKRVR